MKDVSKISKSFTCECGTVNKFEFETDFDVHDVTMAVRCQECSREKNISLMSFFRRNGNEQEQPSANALNPEVGTSMFEAALPIGDLIASTEQVMEPQPAEPQPVAVQNRPASQDDEDLSYEEKEAFSDLFGKL